MIDETEAGLQIGRFRNAARVIRIAEVFELADHARHLELEDRERGELEAAGQPIYELPLIAEGIDLAALHKLAAELRDQGAA